MRGWLSHPKNRAPEFAPVPQGPASSDRFEKERLVCYGCTHSAVTVPYPSAPSGERPCGFCIRNPFVRDLLEDGHSVGVTHSWYDGSEPISTPMDAYYSLDMKDQIIGWIREAAGPTAEEKQAAVEGLLELRKVVAP